MAGTITVGTLLSDATSSNKITIGSGTTLDLASGSAGTITLDAADLTGALPVISGANLTNLPASGKVLQVLSTSSGSELMVSSTYNSTGAYITITPSATTSKILVIANSPRVYNNATERVEVAIYRGTSGEGSGSAINQGRIANGGGSGASHSASVIMVLDSPASTAAQTYTIMHRNQNNSTLVGWCDGGGGFNPSTVVMEIGV